MFRGTEELKMGCQLCEGLVHVTAWHATEIVGVHCTAAGYLVTSFICR